MRFLGLKISDKVPDSKTIWLFRERLIDKEVIEKLFSQFNDALDRQGIFANEGRMIDASFVEAPRQRNTRDENKQIKAGQTPPEWKENPHKLAQKDVDARWTKKNNVRQLLSNHLSDYLVLQKCGSQSRLQALTCSKYYCRITRCSLTSDFIAVCS